MMISSAGERPAKCCSIGLLDIITPLLVPEKLCDYTENPVNAYRFSGKKKPGQFPAGLNFVWLE